MFKVGIVGCGGIGMAHADSWKMIDDVKVTAVVDIDLEKAKEAARRLECGWSTDVADLPRDLDGVSVATSPGAHYPVVKKLLERGFHVFCEKPLTLDAEQGRELDKLAEKHRKVLGVGFKMRFEPIFRTARELLPRIGNLVHITTTKMQAFNPRPEGAWVKQVGAMYELSIHEFDLIGFITGLPYKRVLFARLDRRFGWPAEDGFGITAEFGDGVTAFLEGMYAVECPFAFRDLTMTFLGDRGYLRVERPDRIVVHAGSSHRVVEIEKAARSAFVCELEHFKNCTLGREKMTLSAADAIAMTELIESARRMAEATAPVPWTPADCPKPGSGWSASFPG